jgi:RHS repeat-associated protein
VAKTFRTEIKPRRGRCQRSEGPGGASANYLYFPNSADKRLQQIKNLNNNTNANKNFISEQDYTYDAEGQVKTWTKNYSGIAAVQRLDLGYDNADQLLTAPVKNNSTNALIKQYTYGYDTASNRTSETVATATTTSTPNNVNEITSQTGGVTRTLTHDLNGSITSDGGTRTFEWDGANRLVAINYTGFTTRSEFTYDGLSRVAKIVEKTGSTINSTRKFVWSGQEKLEFRDATDAVTQRNYAQGQYVGTTPYFYLRDHLGSIREMFTGGGTVVARYDYDPYGRSTTVLGTTPTDFNFTGLYRHSKSNLDLATYRAYDPDLGRWLSRDPLGEQGGMNLYGYVGNSVINYADPDGRNPVAGALIGFGLGGPVGAIIGAGIGTAVVLIGGAAIYDYIHNNQYIPDQPLPTDDAGRPVPSCDGDHTQIGGRDGRRGRYRQTRPWINGEPGPRTDWTDHGRPDTHDSPHDHPDVDNPSGGTPQVGPAEPHVPQGEDAGP